MSIKGSIELILEDKDGNVKQSIKKDNAQTKVFKTQMFYGGLSRMIGGAKIAIMNNTSNFIEYRTFGGTNASETGIYCLPEVITEENMYPSPLSDETGFMNLSKASYYNEDRTNIDMGKVLAAVPEKSYFDPAKNKNVCEYMTFKGSGVIKSIIFGKSATSKIFLRNIISDRFLNSKAETYIDTKYVLEHTANGTIVWKTKDTHNTMSFNFKTKEYNEHDNAMLNTNIPIFTQGYKIGNGMYKVSKSTSDFLTVTLSYVNDCFIESSVKTLNIKFNNTGSSLAIPDAAALMPAPVMVYNTDNDRLEIFHTTSEHLDYYNSYYTIQKATINLSNMTFSIETLPSFPYAVSSGYNDNSSYDYFNSIGYHHSIYYNGCYYIPYIYTGVLGVRTKCIELFSHSNNYNYTSLGLDGLITSDFQTIQKKYSHISSEGGVGNNYALSGYATQIVISDEGVVQCRVGQPKMPYVYVSSMSNYLNLDEPIIKTEDDVLRIRYTDSLEPLEEGI